jgi:hypothetical protein
MKYRVRLWNFLFRFYKYLVNDARNIKVSNLQYMLKEKCGQQQIRKWLRQFKGKKKNVCLSYIKIKKKIKSI